MTAQRERPHIEPVLYRLADAGTALGLSERAVRRLIEDGEIETVRLFSELRVVPQSLIDYRERLRKRAATPAAKRAPARKPRADLIYLQS